MAKLTWNSKVHGRGIACVLLALTIGLATLPMSHVFIPDVSALFNAPIVQGQVSDSNGQILAKYGALTQYNEMGPSVDNPILFVVGLMAHSGYDNVGVSKLHVTLSASQPDGTLANGLRFGFPTGVLHSPDSNAANLQQVLKIVRDAILDQLPHGIGSGIENAISFAQASPSPPFGFDDSDAYADWTYSGPSYVGLLDSGIKFAFQFTPDNSIAYGTYAIRVAYHVEIKECVPDPTFGGCAGLQSWIAGTADATDTIYYCYHTCTMDFGMSASPSTLTAIGGSSTTTRVTVSSLGSFTGPLSLAASGDPSLQLSLDPQTLTLPSGGSSGSTLTVSVPTFSCTPGTFNAVVTASTNGISHSITMSITENCPSQDFGISIIPATIYNIETPGCVGVFQVTLTNSGYHGTVSLSASRSVTDWSGYQFSSTSVNLGNSPSVQVSFSVWGDLWHATGIHNQFTVQANAPGLTHSYAVTASFVTTATYVQSDGYNPQYIQCTGGGGGGGIET